MRACRCWILRPISPSSDFSSRHHWYGDDARNWLERLLTRLFRGWLLCKLDLVLGHFCWVCWWFLFSRRFWLIRCLLKEDLLGHLTRSLNWWDLLSWDVATQGALLATHILVYESLTLDLHPLFSSSQWHANLLFRISRRILGRFAQDAWLQYVAADWATIWALGKNFIFRWFLATDIKAFQFALFSAANTFSTLYSFFNLFSLVAAYAGRGH